MLRLVCCCRRRQEHKSECGDWSDRSALVAVGVCSIGKLEGTLLRGLEIVVGAAQEGFVQESVGRVIRLRS